MGASGSMQDQNRYNRMGSASGGALTDLYGKMMSTDQGGRPDNGMMNFGGGVQMYPEEALGRFFSGNPIKLTRQQYEQMTGRSLSRGYDQSIRSGNGGAASGTQSGGGLANARVGINPPLRSDQAVRQGK